MWDAYEIMYSYHMHRFYFYIIIIKKLLFKLTSTTCTLASGCTTHSNSSGYWVSSGQLCPFECNDRKRVRKRQFGSINVFVKKL